MITRTEFINLILPIIKEKLIGQKHPIHRMRTITDVRISFVDQSHYSDGGEYDDGYSFDYTEFLIEVETKTPSGKNVRWEEYRLN